jgi:hypothetical protein
LDHPQSRTPVRAYAFTHPSRTAWYRIALAVLAAGALAALALAPAAGQANGAPQAVIEAVVADLAEREDVDDEAIEVLRTEGVTWSDGCLGAAEPGEACTQALVPGYVVWLGIGDNAFRYHTGDTGAQFRFADGPIAAANVAGAPIPEGVAEDDPIDPLDVIEVFAAFGVAAEATGEVAIYDWIPADGAVVIAEGARVEVFELESAAAVEAALQSLHFEAGSAIPPDNATIWAVENFLVILIDADQHAALEAGMTDTLGPPYVSTVAAAPAPPAEPVPDPAETGTGGHTASGSSTVAAALLALVAAAMALGGRALGAPGRLR